MPICTLCGLSCPGAGDWSLCEHHNAYGPDEWPIANRIMCDFFHRKIEPPRLPPEERERIEVDA